MYDHKAMASFAVSFAKLRSLSDAQVLRTYHKLQLKHDSMSPDDVPNALYKAMAIVRDEYHRRRESA